MSRIGPETLGQLYDDHAPALRLYARQFCSTPEDAVQEAFVALARQRLAPEQAVGWLYRVVRNAALATARAERRRHQRETHAASNGDAPAWFTAADDRIDARGAQALLEELEAEVRGVIVARIWGGLTFDAIARAEGCSLTTAHRRYQAGIARLQERLGPP